MTYVMKLIVHSLVLRNLIDETSICDLVRDGDFQLGLGSHCRAHCLLGQGMTRPAATRQLQTIMIVCEYRVQSISMCAYLVHVLGFMSKRPFFFFPSELGN